MDAPLYWFRMTGIVAFTLSAMLAMAPRHVNFFGASVLGIITAVRGGTLRDLIIDVPVFWSTDLDYIWVSLGAGLAVFMAQDFFSRENIYKAILYADGFGASLFAIEATDKVWHLAFGLPLGPILMGTITAIGGGLIRDVLAGHPTLLVNRELYAIPILLGCSLYTALLTYLPAYRLEFAIGCGLLIFSLRAAAIHWSLTLPEWMIMKTKSE